MDFFAPCQSSEASSRPESQQSCESSPPIPKRPSSAVMESFRQKEHDYDEVHREITERMNADLSALEMDDNMADADFQEVDADRESKYEPKRSAGPPQVRIERKVFPNPRLQVRPVLYVHCCVWFSIPNDHF